MTNPPDPESVAARRLAWLEANAVRCKRLHPNADCHSRYRRNADMLRTALQAKETE